ncbi:permease [Thermodesulfobacteriota bacterium]
MENIIKMKEVITQEFFNMWWFILLSIAIAALIKTYKLDLRLRDYLNTTSGAVGIILATVTGVVSPLCSCGILPIAIALSASGVTIPIVIALLVTSPIMGPAAILITKGGLSTEFAVLKLVSAVLMGLFAGFFTQFLVKRGIISDKSFRLKMTKHEDGTMPTAFEISCENDLTIPTMTVMPRKSKFVFFLDRSKDVGLFMIKMLALSFFLEALLIVFVPVEYVTFLVGKDRGIAVLLSAVVGLPLPVNQISVVPVLAALLDMGMSKAAALTLMVAGPVSSFPAMVVLYAMFDKKVFLNYIFVSLFGAAVLGYSYMLFLL